MRRLINAAAVILIVCLAIGSAVVPAVADNAFTLDKAKFEMAVTPGANLPQTMTLSSDPTASPMDMNLEVKGLGQTRRGANLELDASEDTPYSARTYITNITPASFRIEPGKQQKIKFDIKVPADAWPGEKYAIIRLFSNPYGIGQGAAAVVAIDIPVILNVGNAALVPAGQITGLAVTSSVTGTPPEIQTVLLNTGICRIPVATTQNKVVIKNTSGTKVAEASVDMESPSLLPSFERVFIPHPGSATGLPAGDYTVESTISLNGTALPTRIIAMTVTEPLTSAFGVDLVLPGMDADSLVIANYDSDQDGPNFYVDAIAKAGIDIQLTGAAGFGAVIVGKYNDDPGVVVNFSDPVGRGGTGKPAIKYVDVRTPGLTQGTAQITAYLTGAETQAFNFDSLIIAYFNGTRWIQCAALSRDAASGTVSGKVPVLDLSGTVIGIGGDLLSASSTTTSNPFAGLDTPLEISPDPVEVNPLLIGGVALGVFIIGLLVILVLKRR